MISSKKKTSIDGIQPVKYLQIVPCLILILILWGIIIAILQIRNSNSKELSQCLPRLHSY